MPKPLHLFVDPSAWTLVHNYGRDNMHSNVVHNDVELSPKAPFVPSVAAAAPGVLSARPPFLPGLSPDLPLNLTPFFGTDTSIVTLYLHISHDLFVTNLPLRQRMEAIEAPPTQHPSIEGFAYLRV